MLGEPCSRMLSIQLRMLLNVVLAVMSYSNTAPCGGVRGECVRRERWVREEGGV